MFEHRELPCTICNKAADSVTWSKSSLLDAGGNPINAAAIFWALPKSKCKIRGECSLDKKRQHAYGNQLHSEISISYRKDYFPFCYSYLRIHMDYLNAGHAFWHWNNPDCYEGGYSELGFAKFANWYIMLAGHYVLSRVPVISSFQKQYDDTFNQVEFIASFLKYIHNKFYIRMLEKSLASCSLNEHRRHSHIYEEEFNKLTADSLQLIDMIANNASLVDVSKFVGEKTKNYLYQYKYHFAEIRQTPEIGSSYSSVFENKIYGHKIRLPKYSELADLE